MHSSRDKEGTESISISGSIASSLAAAPEALAVSSPSISTSLSLSLSSGMLRVFAVAIAALLVSRKVKLASSREVGEALCLLPKDRRCRPLSRRARPSSQQHRRRPVRMGAAATQLPPRSTQVKAELQEAKSRKTAKTATLHRLERTLQAHPAARVSLPLPRRRFPARWTSIHPT